MGEGTEGVVEQRERIDTLNETVQGLEGDLAKEVAKVRVFEARDIARGADLPPEYGDLLAADVERQIDADSMTEFAAKYNLVPGPTAKIDEGGEASEDLEGKTAETPEAQGSAQLAQMAGGSSSAGEGGQGGQPNQKMTRQEWIQLMKSNPAAAAEALRQGRVIVDPSNPYLDQPEEAVGNPYVIKADAT